MVFVLEKVISSMLSIPPLDFAIIISLLASSGELDVVNRCLGLLFTNGVRDLSIYLTPSDYVPKYRLRLPDLLLSVSVLRSLTIYNCDLPWSLIVDTVKFTSLIHIVLLNVGIDDEVIKYLATSCPLVNSFFINTCPGFKEFCVYGHQNLQHVYIQFDTAVERIDIEASNLSSLRITDECGRGPPQMNLASCEKLKNVSYYARRYSNSYCFTDFLSNFPFVENMIFETPYKCNNLNLSSHSLKTLVLHSHRDLEKIEFNTPNLVSFGYVVGCIETLWFQKLRRILDKKNGFNVLKLYIRARYSEDGFKLIDLEKLKAIKFPPYELEVVELELETHEESLAHIAFVDAVLWCCRPRSLTLGSFSPLNALEKHSAVVKFTYEKLLEQEDQGRTNIQIVSPYFSSLLPYSSSLLIVRRDEGKAISFIKKEVLQEEAKSQRFAGL